MKSDLEIGIDFIKKTLQNNKVVLFMEGSETFPQCGFSAQVVFNLAVSWDTVS